MSATSFPFPFFFLCLAKRSMSFFPPFSFLWIFGGGFCFSPQVLQLASINVFLGACWCFFFFFFSLSHGGLLVVFLFFFFPPPPRWNLFVLGQMFFFFFGETAGLLVINVPPSSFSNVNRRHLGTTPPPLPHPTIKMVAFDGTKQHRPFSPPPPSLFLYTHAEPMKTSPLPFFFRALYLLDDVPFPGTPFSQPKNPWRKPLFFFFPSFFSPPSLEECFQVFSPPNCEFWGFSVLSPPPPPVN